MVNNLEQITEGKNCCNDTCGVCIPNEGDVCDIDDEYVGNTGSIVGCQAYECIYGLNYEC